LQSANEDGDYFTKLSIDTHHFQIVTRIKITVNYSGRRNDGQMPEEDMRALRGFPGGVRFLNPSNDSSLYLGI
jgi:hypothetical protein